MLQSFLLKNYRLFQYLEIPLLKRVNLIVGKNNSGKSALLEAIELYASGMATTTVVDQIMTRQETWSSQQHVVIPKTLVNPVRHLFFDHQLPQLGDEGIILGPIEPASEQLQLRVGAFRYEETVDGVVRRVPVAAEDMLTLPEDLEQIELALILLEEGKIRWGIPLDRDLQREAVRFRSLSLPPAKYVTQVIPTRNMTDKQLALLWDAINLTGLDEEVIQGLRLLDKNIDGIAFVDDPNTSSNRIPLIKLRYRTEPLPLKSMGDGIMRLFHITVALVNAQGGILIVDEFENGLHWSVQPRVWEMVFRLAEHLNVQVFASTHSRDCIRGFEMAWGDHEQSGAFFRINVARDKAVSITPYNRETLSDALETDVEVR